MSTSANAAEPSALLVEGGGYLAAVYSIPDMQLLGRRALSLPVTRVLATPDCLGSHRGKVSPLRLIVGSQLPLPAARRSLGLAVDGLIRMGRDIEPHDDPMRQGRLSAGMIQVGVFVVGGRQGVELGLPLCWAGCGIAVLSHCCALLAEN